MLSRLCLHVRSFQLCCSCSSVWEDHHAGADGSRAAVSHRASRQVAGAVQHVQDGQGVCPRSCPGGQLSIPPQPQLCNSSTALPSLLQYLLHRVPHLGASQPVQHQQQLHAGAFGCAIRLHCMLPQRGLCSQVDGDTTMLARDVLQLVREALGRELMLAEVHAVHT